MLALKRTGSARKEIRVDDQTRAEKQGDAKLAERYSRQMLFAPIGKAGQARIRASSVAIVGCGALGTHLAEVMTRAGVGELCLIDRDFVEASNLQRQGLFTQADALASAPKAHAAKLALQAINSDVQITSEVCDLTPESAEDLLEDFDLILDATDNFETRLLINDVAVKAGIPWIYSACVASRALCMPILPGKSACLACLMDELPLHAETCDTSGIIMPAVLAAVAMASAEALKLLSGQHDAIICALRAQDVWSGEHQRIQTGKPLADCACCGAREFGWLSGRKASAAIKLCGRNSVQVLRRGDSARDLTALESRLSSVTSVLARNEFLLRLQHRELTLTCFADGRVLVGGTTDIARARSAVAQVLGS